VSRFVAGTGRRDENGNLRTRRRPADIVSAPPTRRLRATATTRTTASWVGHPAPRRPTNSVSEAAPLEPRAQAWMAWREHSRVTTDELVAYVARMPRRVAKKPAAVFQLHVELEDVTPPVWRRLLVPSNITLGDLHIALNEAIGWTNSHLHQFILRNRRFGDVTMPDAEELALEDERKVRLDALLGEKQCIEYEYDFGDAWRHEVKVEKTLEFDARLSYPLCVGGARACPPEDCGGAGGYEHLLEVLQDEKDPEYDDTITWVGGYFDPEGFDANRTNARLRERCR
jgi:hypothetical protein